MAISERIKEERERLGYTQPTFAALAGASKRSQIGWEQGRSFPDASVLMAWAESGADVGYIVTGVASGSGNTAVLTQQEVKLLENFRCMDEQGKVIVEAAAIAAAKQVKHRKAG